MPDVLARVGDHPGGSGLDAQEPEHGVRRDLQQPHERVRDAAEEVERDREHDRERLGPLQRDRLRDELAEHDGEVGEDREGDEEADRRRERWLHQVRDQRLADGAEEDREDRDPELDGRDEPHGLVHQPKRRSRAPAAARRALLQPRPPRRDERVLGRHEERVPQHEEETRPGCGGRTLTPRQGRRY